MTRIVAIRNCGTLKKIHLQKEENTLFINQENVVDIR